MLVSALVKARADTGGLSEVGAMLTRSVRLVYAIMAWQIRDKAAALFDMIYHAKNCCPSPTNRQGSTSML